MIKRLHGWRLLILGGLGVTLIGAVNEWMVAAAPHEGYCPESSRLILESEDFGCFWSSLEKTSTAQVFKEEIPNPLRALELHVRRRTGIRPTPTRWRVWMGRRLVAASAPEGWGLCVYPGVLLRAVERCRAWLCGSAQSDNMRSFGEYHYAWRDGFLIVSESEDYVAACLQAPAMSFKPDQKRDEIQVQWAGQPAGMLRIQAANRLPIEGRIALALSPRDAPLSLADAWPDPPLFSMTASNWSDIATIGRAIKTVAQRPEWIKWAWTACDTLVEVWRLGELPKGWRQGINQSSLAILSIDWTQPVPVPEAALALRAVRPIAGPHPLGPLIAPLPTIPFEWQRRPGMLAPVLGERLSLCLGQYGRDWYLTTNEKCMARLAGNMREDKTVEADAVLALNYRQLGRTLEAGLETFAELEVIPGRNAQEIRANLAPIAKAVGRLGGMRLNGWSEDNWTVFRGFLAEDLGTG